MLKPVEGVLYRTFGVDPKKSQNWFAYAISMLAFSAASFVVLYLILRFQDLLPFNPQGFAGMSAGPGVQHRDQLRHQHQLAVLYAGADACRPSRRWPA